MKGCMRALAVDPGRKRCGVAVVLESGETLCREVVPPEDLPGALARLTAQYEPEVVVTGKGTGCAVLLKAISAAVHPLLIELIDERCSSEAARRRYLKDNPARGLQRLLPESLRTPDRPYDDYAAVELAVRWFQTNKNRA